MKKFHVFRALLLIIWLVAGLSTVASANNDPAYTQAGDSVIVNFGKGGRMVLVLKNAEDANALKSIDFDAIMKEMSALLDSARNSPNKTLIVKNDLGEFRIYAEPVAEKITNVNISLRDGLNIRFGDFDDDDSPSNKHQGFTDFYFGLNNYLENGSIPNGTPYSIRPLGARYFEVAFRKQARIGGDKSPLFFNYALSFSWYNFMFNGNNQLAIDSNNPVFVTNTEHQLRKSKMTVAYLNVPLMFKVKHKKFSFAAGGYVGYRLGSSSKITYRDADGNLEKDKLGDPFSLENVRYGLRAEINWIGPTLFANYDMNNLFTADSGMPKLNVISFGIKL